MRAGIIPAILNQGSPALTFERTGLYRSIWKPCIVRNRQQTLMGESCGISLRRIRMPESYIRNKTFIHCTIGMRALMEPLQDEADIENA